MENKEKEKQIVYGVWVADYNERTEKSKYIYQLDPNMISCGWAVWAKSRKEADKLAAEAGII